MTPVAPGAGSPGTVQTDPRTDKLARLKTTATQLEGVFVQQLFKAMRETVPQDGIADGGSGEEMFTSMFDEKLSDRVPAQWHHGLADAIVSRLKDHVAPAPQQAKP